MATSSGVIDKNYRGELLAVVDNRSDTPYKIKKGNRLFQIVFPLLQPIKPILVSCLGETTRGEGGFGSTNNQS